MSKLIRRAGLVCAALAALCMTAGCIIVAVEKPCSCKGREHHHSVQEPTEEPNEQEEESD